jgi:hypothetical protein
LTAEYLNKTILGKYAQSVVDAARMDTMMNLEEVISQRPPSTTSEGLLALIMFGLAASWDGSNNTGVYYYRHAVFMYKRTSASMSMMDREFYEKALMYWWSGLTFVTDATVEGLSDPPKTPVDDKTAKGATAGFLPIKPHPLTGVSPQSYELMGKVGRLIYDQRKFALQQAFFSFASIKAQEQMFQESQRLEEELRALRLPMAEDVCTTYDANTSPVCMCNTAEASRLCSLLLLYRCFPDLLKNRLTREGIQEQKATERYILMSALRALDILERNVATSGTKSVEQILLVIIAGELKLPNQRCSPPCPFADQDAWVLPTASTVTSPSTLEGTGLSSILDCDVPLSSSVKPRTYETIMNDGVDVQTQHVLAARAKVSARMSAVRSILPYRSVEQAEELIWDIWSKSDDGEDAFWVDYMIRSGHRFVMV